MDLYIPLHVSYRIPIQDDIAFNIFGGAAFQWAISGFYYKLVGISVPLSPWSWRPGVYYQTKKQAYGNGWPEQVNWQAEVGFNFRYKWFALAFTYSFGLNNHHIQNTFDGGTTYETASRSRQDKMQLTLTLFQHSSAILPL